MFNGNETGREEIESTLYRIFKHETLVFIRDYLAKINITLYDYVAYSTDGKNKPYLQADCYVGENSKILFSFDKEGYCNNVSIY